MIGGDYQAIIDEEDFRRRSSPSKKRQNSSPVSPSRRGRSLLLPESPAPAAAEDMSFIGAAIKLTRKCGTPFCTLPDFHDGPCSCTVVSAGRRTAKQAPEPVEAEAVPKGVALEQNRLSGLVKKRGREPAWRLDCPKGEKRRATGRQRSNISLNAAERREAGQGAACLRGWSGAERDLFALGIGLYGKDMRAIRHTLLPARSLPELVAFYYLQPSPSAERGDAAGAVGAPAAAPVDRAGAPACCECTEPMAEPGWRCTSSAGCVHATCSRCREAAIPSGSLVGDARAHGHFWLCAPCSGRLRAAHRALLGLAHAACVSCGSIKPAPLLGSNPWLRGVSTCSTCLARFAVPVAEELSRGEEAALAPLCCQLCTAKGTAHSCSAEGCPHTVCSRCILRCAGQERLDQLAADKEEEKPFLCALHDATLKCAVIRWTRQALS